VSLRLLAWATTPPIVTRDGERRSLAVIQLKRRVTPPDVDTADLAGLADAARAERLGRLVAGGEVSAGRGPLTAHARPDVLRGLIAAAEAH
jgi:hypothetical protein